MWQGKLHRATCRRFDTIPACDGRTVGQTDGIAVASTSLAKRRAVNTIFTLNFHEFLQTMYKYVLNSVVEIAVMIAQYFKYYAVIL